MWTVRGIAFAWLCSCFGCAAWLADRIDAMLSGWVKPGNIGFQPLVWQWPFNGCPVFSCFFVAIILAIVGVIMWFACELAHLHRLFRDKTGAHPS